MASLPVLDPKVIEAQLATVGGRAGLERLVVGCRTEWWTGFAPYDLVPHQAKTMGLPEPKQVDAPAVRHDKPQEIGLDAEGRKVLERRYWQGKVSGETFFAWRGDEVLAIRWSHGLVPGVEWMNRWRREGGRFVGVDLLTNDGWRPAKTFEYDGHGRLVKLRQVLTGPADDFDYQYDESGKLAAITRTTPSGRREIFKAKAKRRAARAD